MAICSKNMYLGWSCGTDHRCENTTRKFFFLVWLFVEKLVTCGWGKYEHDGWWYFQIKSCRADASRESITKGNTDRRIPPQFSLQSASHIFICNSIELVVVVQENCICIDEFQTPPQPVRATVIHMCLGLRGYPRTCVWVSNTIKKATLNEFLSLIFWTCIKIQSTHTFVDLIPAPLDITQSGRSLREREKKM